MRVIVRAFNLAECPAAIRGYLGQSLITTGNQYDVHALAVFEGITIMQIVDDVRMPNWRPGWLFEVIEPTLPSDWICTASASEPSLILGPEFVAKDEKAYSEMVELDPDQVERFWERVNAMSSVG